MTAHLSRPETSHTDRLRLRGDAATDADAIRLRTDWQAVLAMTGFAARATWTFGNAAGLVEYVEDSPSRCSVRRTVREPATVRLRLERWDRPVARADGKTRILDFATLAGTNLASVRLDGVEPAIDELLWLLASDAPPAGRSPAPVFHRCRTAPALGDELRTVERRGDFDRIAAGCGASRGFALMLAGPLVATPLPTDALAHALAHASDAGIPVRVRFENAGGCVAWAPAVQDVLIASDYVELRSPYGRAHLARRMGPTWLVHLAEEDSGGPSIEAESLSDGGWIRLDVLEKHRARPEWRRICHAMLH